VKLKTEYKQVKKISQNDTDGLQNTNQDKFLSEEVEFLLGEKRQTKTYLPSRHGAMPIT
jgi:hypothetical protein